MSSIHQNKLLKQRDRCFHVWSNITSEKLNEDRNSIVFGLMSLFKVVKSLIKRKMKVTIDLFKQ